MSTGKQFALILVTAPDVKTARKLAKAALNARLVACANLIPRIESLYWWQGVIETGTEVLVIFKTTRARLHALERLIVARHPYDTPEFLVLDISRGNKKYLDWLLNSSS
jgi:periplasmic divalent cation tolerance protein